MFTMTAGMILAATVFTASAGAADAILINFTADHCAPCQAMKPTLTQLERSGIPVRHVDVVNEPDLASRYGIRKTPTFVVVSGGKEVTRLAGMQTLAQLRAALAINPSGPLIPTGSMSSLNDIPAPQTRLAPVNRLQPQSTSPKTFTSVAAAPPRSEPMPSLSLADAVQRAQAATVRLRVHDGHGFGAGTGTIIDTHGDEALVLTCGHLFRETKGKGKIEVDLFIAGETRTVLGQVVDYDSDTRDVALVVIRPGFPVQPVQVVGADSRVENGQTAFSFGCDRGDDPSRRDTRITGINKYNQHLGVSNLEISGAPIDGRSGGGLFDASGRLIGVCNAADYKGDVGIYAGPGSIQWQLDRVGMSKLYQDPSPTTPASPNAPPERIASLPGSNVGLPESAIQPTALAASGVTGNQEVIVIVRDRNNPDTTSKVMTLQQPTADLMQMIERQSR
jgi:thiol-disulfide isomerase/thioredoxin